MSILRYFTIGRHRYMIITGFSLEPHFVAKFGKRHSPDPHVFKTCIQDLRHLSAGLGEPIQQGSIAVKDLFRGLDPLGVSGYYLGLLCPPQALLGGLNRGPVEALATRFCRNVSMVSHIALVLLYQLFVNLYLMFV